MFNKLFILIIFTAVLCTACSSTHHNGGSNVKIIQTKKSSNEDVGYTSYNGGIYTKPVNGNNTSNNNDVGYTSYNGGIYTRPADNNHGTYTQTVPINQGQSTYYPKGGYDSYGTSNPQYATYSYQV